MVFSMKKGARDISDVFYERERQEGSTPYGVFGSWTFQGKLWHPMTTQGGF